jgi:hypothetical protein
LSAAGVHKQNLFDSLSDREAIVENEDTRHLLSSENSLVSEVWHCGSIMREKNAAVLGCPTQKARIIDFRKSEILCAEKVELGDSQKQSSDNIAVEVLIGEQMKHGFASC